MRAREGAGIRAELDRLFKTLGDASTTPTPSSPSTPPVSSLFAPTPFSFTTAPSRPRKRATGATKRPTPVARRLFGAAKSPLRKTKAGRVTKRSKPRRATTVTPAAAAVDVTDGPSTSAASLHVPTALTGKKNITRSKMNTSTKVLRETVDNKEASVLGNFNWTTWERAFLGEVSPRWKHWKARQGGHLGFRNTKVLYNTENPAVYELAAQTNDDCTPKAVWMGCTSGFTCHNWDTHFLTSQLQDNIDSVLRRGGKVFVRRATHLNTSFTHNADVITTFDDARKALRDSFDYAWSTKSSPRRELFLRRSRRSVVVARRGIPY